MIDENIIQREARELELWQRAQDGKLKQVDFIGAFGRYDNLAVKMLSGYAVIGGAYDQTIPELFAAIKKCGTWRRKKRIKRPSVYVVLSARHDKGTGDALRTFKECAEVFDRSVTVYRYWYTEALIIARSIYKELKGSGSCSNDNNN